MQYAHSHGHQMFEAPVFTEQAEEPKVRDHQFRHNFATFTGGLLTGAVLATAGIMAMHAYEQAMQPVASGAEQSQVTEAVIDKGGFSVGAQVK